MLDFLKCVFWGQNSGLHSFALGLCLAWPRLSSNSSPEGGRTMYDVCCLSSCPGRTSRVELPPWALEAWKWSRQPLGPARHYVASSHHTHISVRYSIDCSAHAHHQLLAHTLTNEEKWRKILSAVVFIFPGLLNKIPQPGGLKIT